MDKKMKKKVKKIDHIAFSRKGGLSTKARHGSEHYRNIQKKGVLTILSRYGSDYYKNMAIKRMEKRREKLQESKKKSIDKFADILSGKLN